MRGVRAVCFVAALATMPVWAETIAPPAKVVGQFLETYCLDCHDSTTQKGDRDFEKFALPLKSVADLISAKDIIDQITLKEMPPKKADQPTDDERLAVCARCVRVSSRRGGRSKAPARAR